MAAYVIVDIEIKDPEKYKQYVSMTPASLEAFGGRFIVRGGHAERVEGEWEPRRVVVIEFDNIERAREWWASDAYREPKALRQSAAHTNMIFVEGV
jgi:uncharacterized protein (DUF1330 family)